MYTTCGHGRQSFEQSYDALCTSVSSANNKNMARCISAERDA